MIYIYIYIYIYYIVQVNMMNTFDCFLLLSISISRSIFATGLQTVAMDTMRTPISAPPPGGRRWRRQRTSSTTSSTLTGMDRSVIFLSFKTSLFYYNNTQSQSSRNLLWTTSEKWDEVNGWNRFSCNRVVRYLFSLNSIQIDKEKA